ncbi:MAG TPA: FKBP-type peptidyl-prolyl cis-trans isomerase, partial [Azospira sp.]|nr:FKBP-type peptidyl-prolyl cis-trans isomerase [Azospira sp.]
MQVVKDSVVTLDYNVTDPDGVLVDAGKEPLVYLHGGHEDIFPKIEEALEGKGVGETVKVKLQPDDAFGEYDAELVQIESRDSFPETLEVGMQFEGAPEGGDDEDFILYRVTEIAGDKVVVDGNHPLAGT